MRGVGAGAHEARLRLSSSARGTSPPARPHAVARPRPVHTRQGGTRRTPNSEREPRRSTFGRRAGGRRDLRTGRPLSLVNPLCRHRPRGPSTTSTQHPSTRSVSLPPRHSPREVPPGSGRGLLSFRPTARDLGTRDPRPAAQDSVTSQSGEGRGRRKSVLK